MRVIDEKRLRDYWISHPDIRGSLETWLVDVKRAEWIRPSQVQERYGSDAILNERRAVFNLHGNRYRLVVEIHYKSQIVFIRFIGTHAEYNRIDALSV